jgi:hypothetical protein
LTLLSAIWENAIASPATASPTAGVTTNRLVLAIPTVSRPMRKIADGDRGGERDRPAEVAEVGARELRQLERRDRDLVGAEAGPRAHPDPDQRSDPGCEQPGKQDEAHPISSQTSGLDQNHRGDDRRAEQEGQRCEYRRSGHDLTDLRRRVAAYQAHRQQAQSSPHRDQRRLGTDHRAEADRGECGNQHSGELDRLGGHRVEAIRGHVPSRPRQPNDREGDDHSSQCKHGQRPPQRGAVESKSFREVGVDPSLHVEDELEESPGDERGDDAHQRGENEQSDELPAGDRRGRARWRAGGFSHRPPP